MSREKQIEEMAKVANDFWKSTVRASLPEAFAMWFAEHLYNAGYRKQNEGEWIIGEFESPVCSACGKVSLKNGYEEYVKSNFCPNCGARMKGGAE
jgi:hypothetical protein